METALFAMFTAAMLLDTSKVVVVNSPRIETYRPRPEIVYVISNDYHKAKPSSRGHKTKFVKRDVRHHKG